MTDPQKTDNALAPEEIEAIRENLLLRRAAVTKSQAAQLAELNDPGAKSHLADLDEMSDSADTDSFCEIIGIQDATVNQIDEALLRIESGSYGLCEDCDKAIPRARLEALPFANVCVECQRQRELHPDGDVV